MQAPHQSHEFIAGKFTESRESSSSSSSSSSSLHFQLREVH
jgi:hypothetical protein